MARTQIIYAASEQAQSELSTLLATDGVPTHLKTFVETVCDLHLARGDYVPRADVTDKLKTANVVGINKSTMANRDRALIEQGVLKDQKITWQGKPAIRREITKLLPLVRKHVTSAKPERQGRALGSEIQIELSKLGGNFGLLIPTDNSKSRIEKLFTGFLDAAVRLSARDKRKEIKCKYVISRDESVHIHTRCRSGSDSSLMALSDYRVIRALNEMFCDWVEVNYGKLKQLTSEDKASISGDFCFDIYDLLSQMGLSRKPASANQVRKILDRITDTSFTIDASESPTFRQRFLNGAHVATISYFSEGKAYRTWEEDPDNPKLVNFSNRVYSVRFNSSVLQGLLDPSTRHVAHPGLMSERSGIAHRLSNFCKIRIGVRPLKNERPREFLLDELWEDMIGTSELDNFNRNFIALLTKMAVGGPDNWSPDRKCTSLIYGYYVEYDPDPENIRDLMQMKGRSARRGGKLYPIVRIWRDKEDAIVGDNSAHNKGTRRAAQLYAEQPRLPFAATDVS